MKKMKRLFYVLTFLPLALTLIALVVLPERVPMHYDMAGNIDRWGSKYENLILPAVIVLAGLIYTALMRGFGQKEGTGQKNVLLIAFCGVMAVFNIMTVVLLMQSYLAAAGNGSQTVDLARVLFTATGVVFIALGNALPKVRRNATVGVRTTWSQTDDEKWRKSQVVGGIAFIILGLVLIVGNLFFFPEAKSLPFSLLAIMLMIPVTLFVLWLKK